MKYGHRGGAVGFGLILFNVATTSAARGGPTTKVQVSFGLISRRESWAHRLRGIDGGIRMEMEVVLWCVVSCCQRSQITLHHRLTHVSRVG